MKPCVFTGSCVALATPMTQDGLINTDVLMQLIEVQIAAGTDAILVCGTSGEAATLTAEERRQVLACAVRTVHGRVPLLAGTGSNDTRRAIALSREAQELGADALLVVTPYYNKASQEGLVRHFTAVADSVTLPVLLYNVPSRTGVNLRPETYRLLAQHPRIVGAKEAGGDIAALAATRRLCGDELWIYSGNDDQIVPVLSLGGAGVISVLANVAPALTHALCAAWFAGDCRQAMELQLRADPLIRALFADVNPIPVKCALNLLGFAAGPCRLPLCGPSPAVRELLVRELRGLGLPVTA